MTEPIEQIAQVTAAQRLSEETGAAAGCGFPEIAKLGAALEAAAGTHDSAELETLLNQFAHSVEWVPAN